jgi:hypothetical protein
MDEFQQRREEQECIVQCIFHTQHSSSQEYVAVLFYYLPFQHKKYQVL